MSGLSKRLSRFVNANIPGGTQSCYLFHYTGIDTLEALLKKDEDLYAKHCSYCFKQGEILPGCKAFLNRLEERRMFSKKQCTEVYEFIETNVMRENPKFAEENGLVPYVTCFSYDSDSDYHWRNRVYSGGRCAIKFVRKELETYLKELQVRYLSNSSIADPILLLPCFYLDSPVLDQYLDAFIDSAPEDFCGCSISQNSHKGAVTTIVLASVFLKESNFKEECEWRLVRWLSDCRLKGQLAARKAGGMVCQMNGKDLGPALIYAGLHEGTPLFRNLIRGVVFPSSSSDNMEKVKKLLEKQSMGYEQISDRELTILQA